ncbi:hypothetical protein [Flavobacterium sp.]|uniref:hypothetical protein n=1 Tax=Flavobacterium sp. TaxID=239 RepID=UPI003D10C8F1
MSTKSTIFAQKPKVIILGVEHSSQLINYNHQPSALRTFINKVNPAAICIERSPEEFSRNDFYEFTYEQQYVIIPFANQKKIPLHPIDWYPDSDDLKLAFGMSDLEVPAFTRQEKGFLGFTTFTENIDFEKDLYFADNPEYVKSIEKWYANLPEKDKF